MSTLEEYINTFQSTGEKIKCKDTIINTAEGEIVCSRLSGAEWIDKFCEEIGISDIDENLEIRQKFWAIERNTLTSNTFISKNKKTVLY